MYEKGSPRGNLARVLVVHLVEGGSSTTGEQTNCDLTCYVKKRGKPCGAYLRGKALYTGVLLMCPVNSQNEEKLAQYAVSPTHGRGGSQDEEKNLLLPPFTPRPYLGQRDYHIVWNIYVLQYSLHLLIQGHYKNTFCIYTRPQIVIETKVTTPSFPVYGSISKSLQPRQTVSGRINFVVCTSNVRSFFSRSYVYRGINQNECMHDH